MINAERAKNGLEPLALVIVDMVLAEQDPSGGQDHSFSNKISSSHIRKYIQKQQASDPK